MQVANANSCSNCSNAGPVFCVRCVAEALKKGGFAANAEAALSHVKADETFEYGPSGFVGNCPPDALVTGNRFDQSEALPTFNDPDWLKADDSRAKDDDHFPRFDGAQGGVRNRGGQKY